MKLKSQKQLASRALGISPKRIKFNINTDVDKKEFSEIISRENIRELVTEGRISKLPVRGNSRTRSNKIADQKKKGRRKGQGSRKGTANARLSDKTKWIEKIRAMRKLLLNLKENEKIDGKVYRDLYRKAKGNFFRNKKHILLYIKQQNLELKKEETQGGSN
ncbi:MAG: 50S ribosomal protein L19e [Nanoarchaeota archaeon]|nr:50S ribosomal protein L19e [Nanoarchaeota archaeon]